LVWCLACALAIGAPIQSALAAEGTSDHPWVTYVGKEGPGQGKHIVFVTGDDEYKSEEDMPPLAKILAQRHGFTCTVLFAINKQTGVIDTNTKDNIPGLELLDHADLMVIFTRFRQLPAEQMKHVIDFVNSGHPVIGIRTATHAFSYAAGSKDDPFAKYSYNSREPGYQGGFGRQILGETWINHYGHHGKQSTRGLIAPAAAAHPILRGLKDGDIWGTCDVYEVKLPMQEGITPLIMGQVLTGMNPTDPPAGPEENPKTHQTVNKNSPMMPIAWVREYKSPEGKLSRVFTTTAGGAMSGHRDIDSEGLRRLLVNACYWCVGLEDKITEKTNVEFAEPSHFKRGVKPQDVQP
jgi:hypothetical protein